MEFPSQSIGVFPKLTAQAEGLLKQLSQGLGVTPEEAERHYVSLRYYIAGLEKQLSDHAWDVSQ